MYDIKCIRCLPNFRKCSDKNIMNDPYKSDDGKRNVIEEAESVIADDRASIAQTRPRAKSDVQQSLRTNT